MRDRRTLRLGNLAERFGSSLRLVKKFAFQYEKEFTPEQSLF